MSRYSKKCLVSNDDLLGFFGEKYDALLKQASFLSLIGGNVPEVLNSKSDAFYICVDSSGVELIKHSSRINACSKQSMRCALTSMSKSKKLERILVSEGMRLWTL